MSEERIEIEDLVKRIDDLITVLKLISDDLAVISNSLKTKLGKPAGVAVAPAPPRRVEVGKPSRTIEDAQKVFPSDLARMLYFEETDEYIIIRPRQYLGSDNFAKIASIIRDQLKGEYVSAGRESHFRVPRNI